MTELFHFDSSLLILAFGLDLCFGDPVYKFHPIRLCGNAIQFVEIKLRDLNFSGYIGGVLLLIAISALSLTSYFLGWILFSNLHPSMLYLWQLYCLWSLIALGDLIKHSKKVAQAAEQNDLPTAKKSVRMLVGRNTDKMKIEDCCRATIESISENLTDGVLSPIFYYILFGFPGIIFFKVVSTMDSMVGYKNEKYLKFGWCGARMDDFLNYIPARMTWIVLSLVAMIHPRFSGKKAFTTGWQQHAILPSPNSGWSETAAAGALNLQLVGPIWKNNVKVIDQWVGPKQGIRKTQSKHIYQMNQLALYSTILFLSILLLCIA
tara:strand:+ start:126 stop:1085 length:960 start_codon:yes stop_codon:yes gene_type:complete